MWKIILAAFLIVNAIFWGFFPHTNNCQFAHFIRIKECPSFLLNTAIGTIFYIMAAIIIHF